MSLFQCAISRGLLGLLFTVSIITSTGTIAADSPIRKELDRIRAANQAMDQFAIARLELEKHYLDQIRSLREKGFASWLELSRQQVVVDSLSKQHRSLQEFDSFVDELELQFDQISGEISFEKSFDHAQSPIKVYLPGSIRLVGWLEPGSSGSQQIEANDHPDAAPRSDEESRLIKLAEERLGRAEKRCQDFATPGPAPPQWAQQAQLQRNLARAELHFLRVQHEMQPAPHVVAKQNSESSFQVDKPKFVTADAQADLQLATYRVAWAEANATGRLQSAHIELQRNQLRAKSVEELHANGHSTAVALKKSRETAANARSRLEQEHNRISILKEICHAIEVAAQFEEAPHYPQPVARLDTSCSWPSTILSNCERVCHLVDLRRQYFDLAGQRATSICKLEMRQTYLEKLREANAPSGESPSIKLPGVEDLQASLAAGKKRELKSLKLDIENIQATIQEFDETLAIIAMEESRFILQCTQQDRAAQPSFVHTTRAIESADITGKSAARAEKNTFRTSYSYWESRELDNLYRGVTFGNSKPEYLSFTFDRREGSPLIHSNRYPVSLTKTHRRTTSHVAKPSNRSVSIDRQRAETGSLSIFRPNRFGTYSSQAIYPFGILRSDLRSRVPVGQIPWYLPGSPTNLQ